MTTTARQLATWARRAAEATERRDSLICHMRAEGASLRAVASAAGMTAPGVRRVLARNGEQ